MSAPRRLSTLFGVLAVSVSLATPAVAAEPPLPPHPSEATCGIADDAGSGRNAALASGATLTGLGVVVGLLVGMPALLMRRDAEERANKATYETRQRQYARQERRREIVAITSLSVGGAMVAIGIPLMIAGAAKGRSSRASVMPVLSPRMAGVSARVRF